MTSAARPDMGRSLGLPWPLFRHAVVLLLGVGAVLVPHLVIGGSIGAQTTIWLVIAAMMGVAAGLIGRGWPSALFLVAGLAIGLLLMLASRFGSTGAAIHDLTTHGWLYAGAAVVAVIAHALTTVVPSLGKNLTAQRGKTHE